MGYQPYEGSARQRKRQRRTRMVGIVLAVALLLPIVLGTVAAFSR